MDTQNCTSASSTQAHSEYRCTHYLDIPSRQCVHLNEARSQEKQPHPTSEELKVIYNLNKYCFLFFVANKLCKLWGPKASPSSPRILVLPGFQLANNNRQIDNDIKNVVKVQRYKILVPTSAPNYKHYYEVYTP